MAAHDVAGSEVSTTMTEAKSSERSALIQAILDLEQDRDEALDDMGLAYALSQHLKPDIDRLAALKSGSPESLAEFEVETAMLREGESERTIAAPLAKRKDDEPSLVDLTPPEQARWIFMDRFVGLEQHEEIFGYSLPEQDFANYQEQMDRVIRNLLLLPRPLKLVESNDIQGLQKMFASSLLIFRNPSLADPDGNVVPCSVASLRERFPAYFYKQRKKPYWFERQAFFTDSIEEPQWVLCETEFFNLTLRSPERRLAGFAKGWGLPSEYAVQKTVLEDIYDRIVSAEAIGEPMFAAKCNACTVTQYVHGQARMRKIVYTVQRSRKIALYGNNGTPHWKASRRLWPGLYPTLIIP